MRQHRVDSGSVGINVVDWRNGDDKPVLLLIHGNTGNARAYDPFVEALGGDYGIIVPDLRGRGESDKPEGPYGAAAHAGDMLAVLDALDVPSASVAGWSLGSKIALYMAAHHGEQVERVILLDPGLVGTTPLRTSSLGNVKARLSNSYADFETAVATLRRMPLFSGEWDHNAEAFVRADVEQGPDGTFRHRVPVRVLDAEGVSPEVRAAGLLPKVSCPTLILRAPDALYEEGDQLFTTDDAEQATRILPRGSWRDIPGTNHFSMVLGQPTATIEAVRDFLRETAG